MIDPSPAELLAGVADALEQTVLGEVERGPARNQIQAAIGLVRRCSGAMDGYGPMLHAECLDLVTSLPGIVAADPELVDNRTSFDQMIEAASDVLDGTYPSIGQLSLAVRSLHEQLSSVAALAERHRSDQVGPLGDLFDRMLVRRQQLGLSPW